MSGILLQIMEEGVLTDSTGRKVSFQNAIVVMTSNVGGQVQGNGLGFNPAGKQVEVEGLLRQHFTPEFLGRLDQIIHFEPLGDGAIEAIARKYLRQLRTRVAAQGSELLLPEALEASLCRRCKGKGGARQLRRLVQSEVEGPLAAYLLSCGRKPAKIRGHLEGDKLSFLAENDRTDVQK